jgi:pyrroloquinoline quinone biosynthesis protein D
MTDGASIPAFRRGVKFRFDAVREQWVLLAPEKLFMPDEIAVEILQLIDGARTIDMIVDDLAARFEAPRDEIAGDVIATLDDLASRGAVQL